MIVQLGYHIFETFCRWFAGYLVAGRSLINPDCQVLRLDLLQEDFVEWYAAVKEQYQIPDETLELEFIETMVMKDSELFCRTVTRLTARGFVCSMNDFGSQYSSLNILKIF